MDSFDPIIDKLQFKIERISEDIRREELVIAQCAAKVRLFGQWRDKATQDLRKYRNSGVASND